MWVATEWEVTCLRYESCLKPAFWEIKNTISDNYDDYCPVNAMFL